MISNNVAFRSVDSDEPVQASFKPIETSNDV